MCERFRREATRGLKLRHEHLVTMLEFNEVNGVNYLALEYVPGVDLFEYIRQKDKVDVRTACQIAKQFLQLGIINAERLPADKAHRVSMA